MERKRTLPVLPLMEKTKIKKNFNLYKDIKSAWVHVLVVNLIYKESIKEKIEKRKERDVYLYCRLWRKQRDKKSRQIHKASWSLGQKSNRIKFPFTSLVQQPFWLFQGWILRVAAWKLKLPPDDVN